jgi:F-type H+-transporting ATPase subunit b
MNLALTLVIQGVVFFLVAWAVMKFFWPWLMGAIDERQKKIAAGLAAAAKSEKDLSEAEARSKDIIREARDKAAQILDEAKGTASSEAQRLLAQAHEEAARESSRAREGLRQEVSKLAVAGASRLLEREIDPKAHAELLDKLSAEVARG